MSFQHVSSTAFLVGIAAFTSLLPHRAEAQRGRVTIPADSVIRLELDQSINSRTAARGQTVRARLSDLDRSDLPRETRFEGTVTEVQRARSDRPAMIDMEFRRAILPDGRRINIRGELASLADDDVRQTADGRLLSRRGSGGSFDWKWVGIGAAGGAVLGEILGDNLVRGGLLGGLGGAIYGYLNRDRNRDFRDVELSRGTEFGVRLNQSVAFNDPGGYRYFDRDRFYQERVAGTRDEVRAAGDRVFLNGREIRFPEAGPMRMNGTLYVPLRPFARESGWDLRHYRGADDFVLTTPLGEARSSVGEVRGTYRGGRAYTLNAEPVRIGGEIYVPVEYLSRVGDLSVNWDRRGSRLDLQAL